MTLACLGKGRDEPRASKTLLLATVMLFYSTLSGLKSIEIIQGITLPEHCRLSLPVAPIAYSAPTRQRD
jgi:hypothetical protein